MSLLYATLYRWHLVLTPAVEQQFVLALRERLYASIVSARWAFLVQRRMSDMVHALLSDMERVSASAYQLLTLVAGSTVAMIYIGVAARLSPGLTLVVCAGGLVTLWLVRERSRRTAERSEAVSQANRRVYAMVTESLAGLKVAKSVGAEGRDIDVYRDLTHASSSRYLELLRSFADAKRRLDLASAVGVTVLLLVAVLRFDVRGAGLLLIVFVFARVMPRMLSLQGSAQLFLAGLPAFTNVMSLIAECEAHAERLARDRVARLDLRRVLTFDEVTFSYRIRRDTGARPDDAHHRSRPHDRSRRGVGRGKVDGGGPRNGIARAGGWPCARGRFARDGQPAGSVAPEHRVRSAGWFPVPRHHSAEHAVGLSHGDGREDLGIVSRRQRRRDFVSTLADGPRHRRRRSRRPALRRRAPAPRARARPACRTRRC